MRTASVVIADGTISAHEGDAGGTPHVRIVTSSRTVYDVGFGCRHPAETVAAGEMTVEGDPAAVPARTSCSGRIG